jgi:hypothetical protein
MARIIRQLGVKKENISDTYIDFAGLYHNTQEAQSRIMVHPKLQKLLNGPGSRSFS